MRIDLNHLFTLLAAYLLLLSWNGYIYGHGDMIELLPYAKWLVDSELYTKDFFIQNISSSLINERFVLSYFFSWFGNDKMPLVALLLHAMSSLFLLEGLFRIGQIFIRLEALVWVAILLPFVVFFNWNLGGNEMYIPLVASSTIAKSIGIWAIYFFIKPNNLEEEVQSWSRVLKNNKYNWFAFILLIFSTLIQPLVGLQLFLVLSGVQVLSIFFTKKIELRTFFPLLFYTLTAGVWVYVLQKHFSSEQLETHLLFEFLEFRLPHHFIPSYFSKKAAVLLIPLFAYSLSFYFRKNRDVFLFFVLSLLGILIYIIGVEFFEISTVVSSQWFKITIWLKSFSFIALVAFFENRIPFLRQKILQQILLWGLRILGVLSVFIIFHPISIFKNKPYDFFFLQKKQNNYKIEIAEIAKANTPKDALFIIPMSNTYFKNYSERSTYIDYKAVIHRKAVIPIWVQRIQEIYGVNISTRHAGQDIVRTGDDNYRNLTLEDLDGFSQKGIEYLLTFKEVDLPLEKMGENEEYIIYKLQK